MKKLIVFVFSFLIFLSSCRNESDRNLQTGKDYVLINNSLSHVIPLVIQSSLDPVELKAKLINQMDTINTCAQFQYVSGDTSIMTGEINYNIDFYQGCSDSDGVHKAGIMQCNLNGFLNDVNGGCEVVFDGFQIGGYFLWGGFELNYLNANTWQVITKDLRLQLSKKDIIIADTLVYDRVNGELTPDMLLDDQFLISTKGFLIDRNNEIGIGFSENLIKMADCRWISQGILEIELSNGQKQVVDFGDNDCDNEAVFELNGNQYIIQMQ